jgi:hypothetical protein
MLLREECDALIAIGQASHAWIAGQLARAWGNESGSPRPSPARRSACPPSSTTSA